MTRATSIVKIDAAVEPVLNQLKVPIMMFGIFLAPKRSMPPALKVFIQSMLAWPHISVDLT